MHSAATEGMRNRPLLARARTSTFLALATVFSAGCVLTGEAGEGIDEVGQELAVLPDLIVTDVRLSKASPVAGDALTFSAIVKNQGAKATPTGTIIRVAFAIDDVLVSFSNTHSTSIVPGASVTLSADGGPDGDATWRATVGTHSLRARADNTHRLVESNEANNVREESFTVSGAMAGNVQPISAKQIYDSYGVCAHPTRRDLVYGVQTSNIDAWMSRLATMGASYFRGKYTPDHPNTAVAVAAARRHKMKWLMTVVPEGSTSPTEQSTAETAAAVKDIGDNAWDVSAGIEGINEPNHNRGGGSVPSNWAQVAVDHQRAIWNTARAHARLSTIPIVGPSLHDVMADDSYTAAPGSMPVGGFKHYHQLKELGIAQFQNFAGLHSYNGGDFPTRKLDERLGPIDLAYGIPAGRAHYPTWLTEWGWHNALTTTAGHRPAPEAVTAVYAPRGLLQIGGVMGVRLARYEALDDFDPGVKDEHEKNFGLWRVSSASASASYDPASWTPKPEVAAMQAILTALRDPEGTAPYVPAKVTLAVDKGAATDVEYVVTARADGTATVWLWRNLRIWDPVKKTSIAVSPVNVKVTDRVGARTLSVDASVTGLTVR